MARIGKIIITIIGVLLTLILISFVGLVYFTDLNKYKPLGQNNESILCYELEREKELKRELFIASKILELFPFLT